MNTQEMIGFLSKHLSSLPYGDQIVQGIQNRYKDMDELNASDVLYWLDESLYSTLGWAKKHREMGEIQKADQEQMKAETLSKAIELFPPMTQDPQGNI